MGKVFEMRESIPSPVEIIPLDNLKTGVLWSDGQHYVYHNQDLRAACTCASCHGKRTTLHSLDPETIPPDIHYTNYHMVGNYGIKFDWSDGNNTGIYSYESFKYLNPVI